jgi:hypothetical protein
MLGSRSRRGAACQTEARACNIRASLRRGNRPKGRRQACSWTNILRRDMCSTTCTQHRTPSVARRAGQEERVHGASTGVRALYFGLAEGVHMRQESTAARVRAALDSSAGVETSCSMLLSSGLKASTVGARSSASMAPGDADAMSVHNATRSSSEQPRLLRTE